MKKFNLFLLLLIIAVLAACAGRPDLQSQNGLEESGEISFTLTDSIFRAQSELSTAIPQGTILGVIGITSPNEFEAEFAQEQLIFFLVQGGMFRVVERQALDVIREEQNLHLSGDVDDNTAVSIGRLAGAEIVITGSIVPYGHVKHLNLRALDVETSQILAVSSRAFAFTF